MPDLDPEALTRHLDRLYRAAWALCGSREDAEDLVRETCAHVLSRGRTLDGQVELQYLLVALRDTFPSGRRAAARRPRVTGDVEQLDAGDPSSGSDLVAAVDAKQVYEAIASLQIDLRVALVAVDVAGLSHREAAELLGTGEATIATRLFRARRRVTQTLAGEPEAEAQPSGAGDRGTRLSGVVDDAPREGAGLDGRLVDERQA